MVAGRFGDAADPAARAPRAAAARAILETPRVHYPGVELVVDAELSAETDPYLDDHVFRGERLFAGGAGAGGDGPGRHGAGRDGRDPRLRGRRSSQRPVAVPARALDDRSASPPWCASPGGSRSCPARRLDRLRGRPLPGPLPLRQSARRPPRPGARLPGGGRRAARRPAGDLYGGVLFHQGRFRACSGYRRLRATECLAEISAGRSTVWFGRYLPDRLVLGDPGARDAAIHAIQACIPHATLLPIGVERVVSRGLASDAPLLLAARERSRDGDEFVYDIELITADGGLRERWEGLKLRAVDRIAPARRLDRRPARPPTSSGGCRRSSPAPGVRVGPRGRRAERPGLRHRAGRPPRGRRRDERSPAPTPAAWCSR